MTNSRQKGAAGEREAAKLWQAYYPHCKRQFPCQQQGVQMPDIGSPEMNKLFYVEVKRYGKTTKGMGVRWTEKLITDHIAYCDVFTDNKPTPIMMIREDCKGWMVGVFHDDGRIEWMPWDYFVFILKTDYKLEAK